ncbi:hypothetical protein BOX15_Mlig014853g1 [Macrostomum lignano]|uniref:Uncharacterized protein n=1 Tax=Macrostomum lignano TaxID=282301 RepID=A0A267GMP2_9PLAT|nr:hypothetical protein BOX15_Mlig014853g1 [Macrostomum lignano]
MPGKISRLLLRKGRRVDSGNSLQGKTGDTTASAAVQFEGDNCSVNSGGSGSEKRHQGGAGLLRRLTGRLASTARRRTNQAAPRQPQQPKQQKQQLSVVAPLPLAEACPVPSESAMLLRPPSPLRPHQLRTAAPTVHRVRQRRLLTPVRTDCNPLVDDATDTETAELSSVSASKMESLSLKATTSSCDSSDGDNGDETNSLVSDCVLRLRMTTTEATDSASLNNCNNDERRPSRWRRSRRDRHRGSGRGRRSGSRRRLALEVSEGADSDSLSGYLRRLNCPSCRERAHLPHWPA